MSELDKFDYNEALHTTHIIQMVLQRQLIEHPVGQGASEDMKNHLNKAQQHLEYFYQWCGAEERKLAEELVYKVLALTEDSVVNEIIEENVKLKEINEKLMKSYRGEEK